MDRSVIEQYAAGGEQFPAAIRGLTREDFAATPVPGTWSIGQITLHLMDSDLIASDRMKRVIAEEKPTLLGYDETAFSRNLFYNDLDPFLAAEIFQKNRLLTATLLRKLPPEAFVRVGTHNERGPMTLADLVHGYIKHLEHHLGFIRQKRQLLNKPL